MPDKVKKGGRATLLDFRTYKKSRHNKKTGDYPANEMFNYGMVLLTE